MKSFISLRKSMISGTMAVALLSSSVPYNAALQSYAAETPDTGVTSEIARSIYEAPASENNIVFTAEDAAENAVAKKSSASTLSMAEENAISIMLLPDVLLSTLISVTKQRSLFLIHSADLK